MAGARRRRCECSRRRRWECSRRDRAVRARELRRSRGRMRDTGGWLRGDARLRHLLGEAELPLRFVRVRPDHLRGAREELREPVGRLRRHHQLRLVLGLEHLRGWGSEQHVRVHAAALHHGTVRTVQHDGLRRLRRPGRVHVSLLLVLLRRQLRRLLVRVSPICPMWFSSGRLPSGDRSRASVKRPVHPPTPRSPPGPLRAPGSRRNPSVDSRRAC
jgi:hypothetical protein